MAGKAATLQSGVRLADYLSCGLLARICPPDKVSLALAACGRQSQRQRDLPAHATAYYVMALSLYQGVNYSEVLRIVTEGIQMLGDDAVRPDVGKSGISAARTRLGWQAMAHLAGQVLMPLADERTPGAFVAGLSQRYRLVSLDGSCLEVADQSANVQAFGYPPTGQGRTGYPQIRFTALVENGTHGTVWRGQRRLQRLRGIFGASEHCSLKARHAVSGRSRTGRLFVVASGQRDWGTIALAGH